MLYCIVYCWTEEEGSSAVAAGVRAGGLLHAGGPRPSRNFAQAARSRARCSATEPRFLEGEEAALVEMGEGGARLMFPLFLVGEELVLPSLEEGREG